MTTQDPLERIASALERIAARLDEGGLGRPGQRPQPVEPVHIGRGIYRWPDGHITRGRRHR